MDLAVTIQVITTTAELTDLTDLGHAAMSARKRIAVHRTIHMRNTIRPKKSTKTALVTRLKDDLTTTLRNALSSTSLTIKGTIMRTQTLTRSLKPLLQTSGLN
jgi:hypothetical protein